MWYHMCLFPQDWHIPYYVVHLAHVFVSPGLAHSPPPAGQAGGLPPGAGHVRAGQADIVAGPRGDSRTVPGVPTHAAALRQVEQPCRCGQG